MNDMKIRDAQPSDHAAMLDVTVASYQEYATVMPPYAWEEYKEGMDAAINGPLPVERIVVEQGGAIVGSVLLYPAGTVLEAPGDVSITLPSAEIRLLAVAPSARGKGVGRALTEECIRRVRLRGEKAIALHTTDMMQTAMQMYERMGFVRDPETDFSPAEGVVIKGYIFPLVVED